MSYTIAPAAASLLAQASELWPGRSTASDGTIGDTSHAARASDHNPDSRGIVHAADLTHDPAHGCDNNANTSAGIMAVDTSGDVRVFYNNGSFPGTVFVYGQVFLSPPAVP